MGKKRGALVEFNELLLEGQNTNFSIISGDIYKIQGRINYILTLDADTKLPIDGAKN